MPYMFNPYTGRLDYYEVGSIGPAGPAGGWAGDVFPEDYGAVGDGVTDDWQAFEDMFAAMAADARLQRVVLRPSNYYSIKSAHDATDVFNINVNNIIVEGPGQNRKTFGYDGAGTVTNFFHFTGVSHWTSLREMYIEGHQTRIGNIVYWGAPMSVDIIMCSVARVSLRYSSIAGFNGSAWMLEYDHCEVQNSPIGFGPAITAGKYSHCYANNCATGYSLGGNYSLLLNCCSDHATVCAYKIVTTGSIGQHHTFVECAAEDANQAMNAVAIDGPIVIIGGNYTGVGTTDPLFYFNDAHFHIYGPKIAAGTTNTWWVQFISGGYSAGKRPTVTAEFPKNKIYGFLMEDADSPVRIDEEGHAQHYESGSLSDLDTICADLSSSNFRKPYSVLLSDATPTFASALELKWIRGAGSLYFAEDDLTSAITLAPGSGWDCGFSLEGIDVPIIFENYYFKLNGSAAVFFKIRNCKLIKFIGCKFETAVADAVLFDVDDNSKVEMDKATQDSMTTSGAGTWDSLCSPDPWYANLERIFGFLNYTDKPLAGLFDAGMKIEFRAPATGTAPGAMCTAAGEPGTWKYFAALE